MPIPRGRPKGSRTVTIPPSTWWKFAKPWPSESRVQARSIKTTADTNPIQSSNEWRRNSNHLQKTSHTLSSQFWSLCYWRHPMLLTWLRKLWAGEYRKSSNCRGKPWIWSCRSGQRVPIATPWVPNRNRIHRKSRPVRENLTRRRRYTRWSLHASRGRSTSLTNLKRDNLVPCKNWLKLEWAARGMPTTLNRGRPLAIRVRISLQTSWIIKIVNKFLKTIRLVRILLRRLVVQGQALGTPSPRLNRCLSPRLNRFNVPMMKLKLHKIIRWLILKFKRWFVTNLCHRRCSMSPKWNCQIQICPKRSQAKKARRA